MPFDPCPKFSRKLSAYLDGELSEKEQAALETHLGACASCSAELRAMQSADAGLKALPVIDPSPFFAARTTAAARALDIYHGPLRRFLSFPVPAAMALGAFLLFNIFTFAFNVNALENGQRRELARKVAVQLIRPASLINPVAVARLCGECSAYMCLCMHEAGKKGLCPCKDCEMNAETAADENYMEEDYDVH